MKCPILFLGENNYKKNVHLMLAVFSHRKINITIN